MSLIDGLNTAQREAVTADPHPVLVLAGPGSGKTRVLTHRIAYLIEHYGVESWHILAVTFTNKAAREMRDRVERLVNGYALRGLQMGTFHSTCARLLRRETNNLAGFGYAAEFAIFDGDDQLQLIKQALKELNIDHKKYPPNGILNRISRAKESLLTPEMYAPDDYIGTITKRVYTHYQDALLQNNAMDFDDLLHNTVRLFDEVPGVLQKYQEQWRHILVDEFQDTNSAQYGIITRLAAEHRNIFIVGDSDQSIYKWRGAEYRNLKKFCDLFKPVQQTLLEQNYRSTQLILDAAKAVIKRNSDRVHKELFTERKGGDQIQLYEAYNEMEEADHIIKQISMGTLNGREPRDFAVIYRTNAQSRAVEEAFLRAGLPYQLVGATRFYGRKEIKDLIAYLRVIHNPKDDVSLRRAINTPKRDIGEVTQAKLIAWGQEHRLQAAEAVMLIAADHENALGHPFSGQALKALTRFGNLLSGWITVNEHISIAELLTKVIEQTDFKGYLNDGTDEGQDRWANVLEFRNVAMSAGEATLPDFLEQIALVADVDGLKEEQNAPTLLTLHASKGLEFPVVFIVGLEEGILPHSRAFEDIEQMEEERRLFYVGLTRAKDQLHLLRSFRRMTYGSSEVTAPSRFIGEVPDTLVSGGNQTVGNKRELSKSRMSSWDQSPIRGKSQDTQTQYGKKRGDRSAVPSAPIEKNLPKPRSETVEEHKPVVAQYKTGQKVSHKKFGQGIVIESKVTGSDEEVTVAFTEHGIKKMVASFAKLDIIK